MSRRVYAPLLLFVLAISSCSWSTGRTESSKIVIEYWHQPRVRKIPGMEKETPEYGDYERLLAEEFMRDNPNIEVKTQSLNWEDLPRKVPISIMAGSPPDILQDFSGRTSGYWYQGVLEPLDDVIADVMDDFQPGWIADNKIDGQLHAVPVFGGAQVLALNRAIWKKAGKLHLLPSPEDPTWTASEFETALKAIAEPGRVYPLAIQASSEQGDYGLLQFLWSKGAKIYDNQDYSRVLLNSDDGVKALEWLVSAHKQGLLPPNVTSLSGGELSDLFLRGGSACVPAGADLETSLKIAKQEKRLRVEMDLMFAMPPTPKGEKPKVLSMTGGLVVFKQPDERKKQAVMRFVRFLSTPKALQGYSIGGGITVGRKSVPNPSLKARFGKVLGLIEEAESIDMGVMSPHYYAIRRLLPPQLQSAFLGQKTSKQALDAFCREAHTIIRQSEETRQRQARGESRRSPPWLLTATLLLLFAAVAWVFRRQLLAP